MNRPNSMGRAGILRKSTLPQNRRAARQAKTPMFQHHEQRD